MQLQEFVDRWYFDYSPNTRRRYMTAARLFAQFLNANPDTKLGMRRLVSADLDDVLEFFKWLRSRPGQDGKGESDKTLQNCYAALRSIYRRFEADKLIQRNPFLSAKMCISWRRKAEKRPTALIPFDKVYELLDLPDGRTPDGIRDRALLSIMFGGGLRRSEARNLRLADVKVSPGGKVFLDLGKTKSGKIRHQPLPPWAASSFSALVSQRKAEKAESSDFLFVFYYENGKIRGQISESTLYRTFRDYCLQLGIKAAPHAARSTAASMLLERGCSHEEVKEFLGHGSTRMVCVYDRRKKGVEENVGNWLDFPKVANG